MLAKIVVIKQVTHTQYRQEIALNPQVQVLLMVVQVPPVLARLLVVEDLEVAEQVVVGK